MSLFKHGTFLLDNGVKMRLLECIPDSLRCDRIKDCIVDKSGGLYSIIKLAIGDLSNN